MNVQLDNRLYRLQKSALPADLKTIVHEATTAFLQDDDTLAERLIAQVESACAKSGIPLIVLPSLQQ